MKTVVAHGPLLRVQMLLLEAPPMVVHLELAPDQLVLQSSL
jgi:hypothetical protein